MVERVDQYRMDRITRLLKELEYEIHRGMMEGEIDEHLGYRFTVPVSKKIPGGVVMCEFRTRPMTLDAIHPDDFEPLLKVIK